MLLKLTLKWEMFRSCSRSQILLPRYASSRKRVWGGGEAAAWRAGRQSWHGRSQPVEWTEHPAPKQLVPVRVPTLTSSPPTQHPERVFRMMRNSGTHSPGSQNHGR